jgi:dTDP-4-amino-4,6-dideoxygalactose transaminase
MTIKICEPYVGQEEIDAVAEVIRSKNIAAYTKVKQFEEIFAGYVESKYAVAVSSGTAALHCALLACGINPGAQIITTAFSFAATANTIRMCGAEPIFCDINPYTFNMDVDSIEGYDISKAGAIMPVHLYGKAADMQRINEFASDYGLWVINDACQGFGGRYADGKMIGSKGDAECFSFYATKNITTGEGGMVTTNNRTIADNVRKLRHHGIYGKLLGYNYRTTDIAAAIGLVQLKKSAEILTKRYSNAMWYNHNIKNMYVVTPTIDNNHAMTQYTIRVGCGMRDKVQKQLLDAGIEAKAFYDTPLAPMPNAIKASHQVLSLPVHPGLKYDDRLRIVNIVNELTL